MDEQIALMQRGSQERLMNEELLYGQSIEAQVDEDGRLTIPQKLRDKIGLTSEAFFIFGGRLFPHLEARGL